ncbi:RpiR family transcriptional regulator [Sphingomonas sp. DBB INV C78]|uniref:MurR/RpiR family transcriptional regulator n=1 Tax=Sphingomonas sp. DBB INV C78 TaxID=3349434 RepID=UPI0036D39144
MIDDQDARNGGTQVMPAIPNVPLLRRLQTEIDSYTAADRAVAAYILAHCAVLGFETGDSLAEKVGVSEITIGRFARKLGYRNFKALKNELKDSTAEALPWLIGEEFVEFVDRPGHPSEHDSNCQREINALLAVYRLAETPGWTQAVELLAHARTVHVAGFQSERGIAMLLANRLQYMRDGVQLVDLGAGSYADVFAGDGEDRCLVIVDVRRYSRQSWLMAEQASQHGIPTVILTDVYCDWASRFTPHVIAVPTQTGMFWSSPVTLVTAVHLLLNNVVKLIGADVEQRLDKLTRLHKIFTGYAGHQPPRPRRSTS